MGEPDRTGPLRRALPPLLVTLATLAIFAPGATGGLVWDDHALVDEGAVTVATGPLVSVWFALARTLFHDGPLGYHLVSLALHLACVLLAFRWISRRIGPGGAARTVAALAALLFAAHPSRPESVSFVSCSSALFMMLACLLALEVWDRWRSWWATGALLAVAFFCEQTAVVVPLLLVADELLLHRPSERRIGRRHVGTLLALAVGAGLAMTRGHAAASTDHGSAFVRATATLGYYARLLFAPWPSSAFVDPDFLHPTWSIRLGLACAALVFALALAALSLRGARLRPWLADALWLLVPLAPVLNLVPLGARTLVAERFLTLPLLGLAALFARATLALAERRPGLRPVILAGCAALVLASALACARRVADFHSDLSLWTHERALAPDDPDVLQGYALAQWRAGEVAEALSALELAHPRARTSARAVQTAVEWASISLEQTTDDDDARLARLASFFDELAAAANGAVVRLQVERAIFTVRMSPAVRRVLEHSEEYLDHRAAAHARMGEYAIAETLMRHSAALRGEPDAGVPLIRVVALGGRWLDARRLAEEELARRPDDRALRALAEALRTIAQRPSPAEEPAASLERAQRMLLLGETMGAYRILRELVDLFPQDAAVALQAATAALTLKHPDEAWAILVAAEDRMPEHAEDWQRALERVRAFDSPQRR